MVAHLGHRGGRINRITDLCLSHRKNYEHRGVDTGHMATTWQCVNASTYNEKSLSKGILWHECYNQL
jgi:hypothetical protein